MKKNWYAVYTKLNCEKKVAILLGRKKIETFIPLNRITYSSMYRKKITNLPLISSFVFVCIDESEKQVVRNTHGVINFIFWLGNPLIIKEDEIKNIQYFANEYSNITLEKTPVNPSLNANVFSDPQIDVQGNIVKFKNTSVKLFLPALGYIMTTEISKSGTDIFYHRSKFNNLVS